MSMLVDDKPWVARQLSLGKHVAWIEQQRQIPRAEILALGEQIGLHFDEHADVMTSRPKGLDVDPNAPAVHPEGYTNPTTVPARLTGPAAPHVQVADNYIDEAADNSAIETPTAPWTCPTCAGVEPLGERYHFVHVEPAPDPADTRNVGIIGHPSSGKTVAVGVMGSEPERASADRIVVDDVVLKERGQYLDHVVIGGRVVEPVEEPQPPRRPRKTNLKSIVEISGRLGAAITAREEAEQQLAARQDEELALHEELLAEIRALNGVPTPAAPARAVPTSYAQPPSHNGSSTATAERNRVVHERVTRLGGRAAIRDWAHANGHHVGAVGAIKSTVLDAYENAHPQGETA